MTTPADGRRKTGAGGGRLPSVVPLVLVVALVLVVGIASARGGETDPEFVDLSDAAAADQAASAAEAARSDVGDDEIAVPEDRTPDDGTDARAGDDDAPSRGEDPTGDRVDDGIVTETAPTPTPTVDPTTLPRSGSGELLYAPGDGRAWGASPHRPFAVATERGSGVDPAEVAAFVDAVLSDRRSWIGDGVTGFRRVGEGEPVDFTLVVATPDTVDRMCAPLQTAGRYSCATNGWIALNLIRWMTATPEWPSTLDVYRHYLVNHEVGHYILGPDHPTCPEAGRLAPIMQQQTIDLGGCLPNGWVYPDGN